MLPSQVIDLFYIFYIIVILLIFVPFCTIFSYCNRMLQLMKIRLDLFIDILVLCDAHL